MFNDAVFFQHIRPLFGHFVPQQMEGLNVILSVWKQSFQERTPITQFAACLATAFHETNRTMCPIRELGGTKYFTLNYDIQGRNPARARRYGNIRAGDGPKYCGRGLVQLTWYVNYLKATSRLHELGLISDNIDFTRDPDLVMVPVTAAQIMFVGMEEGWFTGKTLDQLVDLKIDGDEHIDYVKSRAIINGTDRAELIAGYADKFLMALKAATA